MKYYVFLIFLILIFPNTALAQVSDVLFQFQRIDRDGDRRISFYESWTEARARFTRMDFNKDGKVTLEENMAGHAVAAAKTTIIKDGEMRTSTREEVESYKSFFRRYDEDGDGIITQYENMTIHKRTFQSLDPSNSGYIEETDFIKFVEKKTAI